MQVGTGTVGGRSGWGRRHQPSLLGTSVSRNGFPEEPGRERERAFQPEEGGTGVHCVPNEGNNKCKGPGVRERETTQHIQ